MVWLAYKANKFVANMLIVFGLAGRLSNLDQIAVSGERSGSAQRSRDNSHIAHKHRNLMPIVSLLCQNLGNVSCFTSSMIASSTQDCVNLNGR